MYGGSSDGRFRPQSTCVRDVQGSVESRPVGMAPLVRPTATDRRRHPVCVCVRRVMTRRSRRVSNVSSAIDRSNPRQRRRVGARVAAVTRARDDSRANERTNERTNRIYFFFASWRAISAPEAARAPPVGARARTPPPAAPAGTRAAGASGVDARAIRARANRRTDRARGG